MILHRGGFLDPGILDKAPKWAQTLDNGDAYPHRRLSSQHVPHGWRSFRDSLCRWLCRYAILNQRTFLREFLNTMNIYVGNLPYSVTDNDLREAFSAFGEVSSSAIVSDKFSSQSKGFGFVEMPNNSEADEAIKALNDTNMQGRNIKVNQARPRGDRPQRGPRY